jgi:UDP-glucose 4-epimerase
MSKVLLIGGNGFIGRHLGHLLLTMGYGITVLTRSLVLDNSRIKGVNYVVGDYRDTDYLDSLICNSTHVVHLAYESLNLSAHTDMDSELERNIRPVEQITRICLRHNIEKLIVLSSGGTVYGDPTIAQPLTEIMSADPISIYGNSKLFIERIALLAYHRQGLPVCVVRPANAYGPGQLPFKGQGLIATAFGCAYLGREVLMFGEGDAIRDYIHVIDVARGIGAVLTCGVPGQIYNIGTGIGTSINNLIHHYIAPLAAESGYEVRVSRQTPRGVDVSYNVLNSEKLQKLDGRVPIYLNEGLVSTWDWVKENLGAAK